jgi:hypothetical protein
VTVFLATGLPREDATTRRVTERYAELFGLRRGDRVL